MKFKLHLFIRPFYWEPQVKFIASVSFLEISVINYES